MMTLDALRAAAWTDFLLGYGVGVLAGALAVIAWGAWTKQ